MRQKRIQIPSIITISVAVFFAAFQAPSSVQKKTTAVSAQHISVDLKADALEILQQKCNVCHRKKNRKKVFTEDNMSALAPKIYKQVFIKQRMPKGNKIKLTTEEYTLLRNWLYTEDLTEG